MSKTKSPTSDLTARALARLRAFVKDRGDMTRAAERIGVGLPTVHRWMKPNAKPHAVYARLILEKLS